MPGKTPKGGAGAAEATPKKRKISQADSDKKGSGVSFEVYHSEAATFQSIGEFKKAINSYTRALELRPTDKNCLIARAQCYQQLGEADKALADANETLKQEANFIKGLLMKAEAYYQMMQFEYALMFYHRGNKLRPEVQAFRLGIQKSQEAIENSIGDGAGIHLENKGDLSFFYSEQQQQIEATIRVVSASEEVDNPILAARRSAMSAASQRGVSRAGRNTPADAIRAGAAKAAADAEGQQRRPESKADSRGASPDGTQKQKKQVGGYTKAVIKTEEKVERRQRTTCTDAKTVKELLGELYTDKEYLEKLLRETESATNQSETNKAIRTLTIQGLDYLDTRTEFWQQQKPMYSRRRDRKLRENANGQNAEIDKSKEPLQWVLKNLEDIDEAQAEGRYEDSMKQAKRVLKEVEQWSDRDIRNRYEMMGNLHSQLGNAYLETGKYSRALDHHNKDYELANKHELPDAKSRALDNLGRVHARMGNFDMAIQVWQEKLPTVKSSLESTWLYHEIGRCHLELSRFDEAKEYGEKSLNAAEEADDILWQLNASVLIAQANVKLGELDDALDNFNRALELAKTQSDKAAESAIRRAIDDVNNTIDKQVRQGERKEVQSREIEYTIKVHTGDGATDASVYVIIVGDRGETDEKQLVDSDGDDNTFQSNQERVFKIEAADIGKVKSLKIRHDNKGKKLSWYLDHVEVVESRRNKTFVFQCQKWLSKDKDDGKIVRELFVSDSKTSGQSDNETDERQSSRNSSRKDDVDVESRPQSKTTDVARDVDDDDAEKTEDTSDKKETENTEKGNKNDKPGKSAGQTKQTTSKAKADDKKSATKK